MGTRGNKNWEKESVEMLSLKTNFTCICYFR